MREVLLYFSEYLSRELGELLWENHCGNTEVTKSCSGGRVYLDLSDRCASGSISELVAGRDRVLVSSRSPSLPNSTASRELPNQVLHRAALTS
jgi:hypothetical protein